MVDEVLAPLDYSLSGLIFFFRRQVLASLSVIRKILSPTIFLMVEVRSLELDLRKNGVTRLVITTRLPTLSSLVQTVDELVESEEVVRLSLLLLAFARADANS